MMRTICDRCHGQKLRCDRDDETLDSCKRCKKAGAICTFPDREIGDAWSRKMTNQRFPDAGSTSMFRYDEEGGECVSPPAKTRRISPQQTSTNSYYQITDPALLPAMSRERSMQERRNERANSSPISSVASKGLGNLGGIDLTSNIFRSEVYDPRLGSGPLFNFLSPQTTEQLDFESVSATTLTFSQEEPSVNAWPSPSWTEQPVLFSTSNASCDRPEDLNYQQSHQRHLSKVTSTAAESEHESMDVPSPSADPTWSFKIPTKKCVRKSCDANMPLQKNSVRLFHMYTSLDGFLSSSIPTMKDAFQYTTMLIEIVRDAPKFQENKADHQKQNRLVSSSTSDTTYIDRVEDGPTGIDLGPEKVVNKNRRSGVHADDSSIVFLILACSLHIIRLYQQLIDDVADKLERTLQSTAQPGSTGLSTKTRDLDEENTEASAMEWVGTVSSVVHLAEKMDATIKTFAAGYRDKEQQTESAGDTFHESLPSSSTKEWILGEDLEHVAANPMRQISKMKGTLKNSIDDIMNRIRASELV